MMNELTQIPFLQHGKSRAINAENPTGEKGMGGRSASALGISRKGSPCLKDLQPGSVTVLADVQDCGIIRHIWMTVENKTSEADCFVLRDLILRMYWDDEDTPSVEVPLGDFFCCGFGQECLINSAPVVVAKGEDYLAQKIKDKAREADVEIVENKPLARMLYFNVDVGAQIPPELYQAVAEVLAYVYKIKNK